MARSSRQKLKLIFLLQFFMENTDEEHPASMKDIIGFLDKNGISAERKSIYDDIEALNEAGYDIERYDGRSSGYYMASRDFELPELKLLVDAVQSSKFISESRSMAIISKIEKLTSHYEAGNLQRQVYVKNRVKTDNSSILYSIDIIHEAVADRKTLRFQYCEWNLKKELVLKNNGRMYNVFPLALIWDDENYYLVACDLDSDKIKHYRVDKIRNTEMTEPEGNVNLYAEKFDPALYVKEHFGMFNGREERISLVFDKDKIGIIIDRFGRNIPIIQEGDKYRTVITVRVSDIFFGWVAGFRGKVRIEGNDDVKHQFMEFIDEIRQQIS